MFSSMNTPQKQAMVDDVWGQESTPTYYKIPTSFGGSMKSSTIETVGPKTVNKIVNGGNKAASQSRSVFQVRYILVNVFLKNHLVSPELILNGSFMTFDD